MCSESGGRLGRGVDVKADWGVGERGCLALHLRGGGEVV